MDGGTCASRIFRPRQPVRRAGSTNRRRSHTDTPAQVEIWIGLDVGKEFHHAVVLNDTGDVLVDRRVTNGQADLV